MMPADLLEMFRVTMGFLVVFGVVPWLVILNSPRKDGLIAHCAAFMQASLFAEITSLALGSMHLCLPGSLAAAYTLFLFSLMFRSGRLPPFWDPNWLSGQLHHLVVFVDRLPSALWCFEFKGASHGNWRKRIDSAALGCFKNTWLFPASVALLASFYPLHNVRLLTADTYSRALSLERLTFGQPSALDGSVTLLAPVVFLSGCDGATVVRFTAPLFAALLALTAFAVVFRLTESRLAGSTSAALVAALAAFLDAGQLSASGLASIFWLLGVVLWRASRLDAMWSVALALLIAPIPRRDTILLVAIPPGIALLARSSRSMLRCLEAMHAPLALAAIACLIYLPLKLGDEEGPYEYETAARAVSRIARELPQNTWLVIAPVQELVFTYGHGWHMQLSEFVSKYTVDQVGQPGFHFEFPVADTFLFVEKEPLVSRAVASGLSALGPRFDPAMVPYQVRLSRASIEFEAGRLLAAYRSRHPEVKVFVEDTNLVVYRIPS
jgi:hypothetical protein